MGKKKQRPVKLTDADRARIAAWHVTLTKLRGEVAAILGLDQDEDLLFDAETMLTLAERELEGVLSDWAMCSEPWADWHYHCYACESIQRVSSCFHAAGLFLKRYPRSTHSALEVFTLQFLERAIPELEALDPEFAQSRKANGAGVERRLRTVA